MNENLFCITCNRSLLETGEFIHVGPVPGGIIECSFCRAVYNVATDDEGDFWVDPVKPGVIPVPRKAKKFTKKQVGALNQAITNSATPLDFINALKAI